MRKLHSIQCDLNGRCAEIVNKFNAAGNRYVCVFRTNNGEHTALPRHLLLLSWPAPLPPIAAEPHNPNPRRRPQNPPRWHQTPPLKYSSGLHGLLTQCGKNVGPSRNKSEIGCRFIGKRSHSRCTQQPMEPPTLPFAHETTVAAVLDVLPDPRDNTLQRVCTVPCRSLKQHPSTVDEPAL